MASPLVQVFRGTDTNSPQHLSHSDVHFDSDSAAHHSYYEASIDNLCLDWFSEGVRLGRQLQHDEDDERLSESLSRYKTRMRAQTMKYEEEVLLRKRCREEMDFLQAQIFVLKDELLAAHAAYEELALNVTTSSSSSLSGPLEAGPHLNVSSAALSEHHDSRDEGVSESSPSEAEEDFHVDGADQSRFPLEFEEPPSSYSNPESPPSDLSDLSESDSHSCQPLCKPDDEAQGVSEIASLMSAAHEGNSIALKKVRTLIRVAERTPKRQRTPAQTHLLVYWNTKTLTTALPPPDSPEIFVDASGYGIGFIFNDSWLAWKFTTAHPLLPLGPDGKLIMSWAELVAVELGIRTLVAAGFRHVTVTVRSDNQGVVVALESGKWTQKYGLNEIVKRILHHSHEAGLSLRMKWIPTKENPADDPSRGVYPPTELAFHCRPSIPRTLSELIHEVE